MALENTYAEVLSTSIVEGYYDESNDSYLKVLLNLLPEGVAWRFSATSHMVGLLEGLSYSFLRLANRAVDILEEFDPRTSVEMIDDWERVLDLPGTNPAPAVTLAERRNSIHTKLLGFGDPTPVFYEQLVAGLGFTVNVVHLNHDPFVAGSPAGDALNQGGWAYAWWVEGYVPAADQAEVIWHVDNLVPNHTDAFYWLYDYTTWTEASNPGSVHLRGVDYGNSLFVAVGNSGSAGPDAYIIYSQDGETWLEAENPSNVTLYSVVHSSDGAASRWVAVGALGSAGADAYIAISENGSIWEEKTNPSNVDLYSVAYGNGVLVAVGSSGSAGADGYILRSTDGGDSWSEITNPSNVSLNGVSYDGSGVWVAVGDLNSGGSDAYILKSVNDGSTWSEITNPSNVDLYSVSYGDSTWIAVGAAGSGGSDTYIARSVDDGDTWSEIVAPANLAADSIHFFDGVFVAVGFDAGAYAYIITSTDAGLTWTQQTDNPQDERLRSVTYGAGKWVAVGHAVGDAYIAVSG